MKYYAQPLVSVLTPVYNGEKYLAECIESVLAQTYDNWEYVIVNNCSTDRTLEIAQQYADKDKRIRIHNNTTFVGCDANGNIAFRQISAESKYCKVVHADDWLYPECILKMVELAEAHPSVAIVGSYGLRNKHVCWDGLPYARSVFDGRDICRETLVGGLYVFGSPTSLLVRSNEVRKRPKFYTEENRHCDIESCFDLLKENDFGFVHQVLTFTRDHGDSETSLSNRFGTGYLGTLEVLTKYGRTYLSGEDYERCIRRCWDKYYTFLGCIMLYDHSFLGCIMPYDNKEKALWEFHRNELGRLGYTLSLRKVATAALVELLDLALNPLKTSVRIARKIGHRLPRASAGQ
jgi:glycosyltransferase involved in cell wall biosynthesis